MCVCGEVWGSVVAVDGATRGSVGSVVVSQHVCLCMGRVASVASVARCEVAVDSARQKKMGWGLSEIRER